MSKARLAMGNTLIWHCPGCGGGHGVPVRSVEGWGWNESLDNPTLTPSILTYAHETSPPFRPQPRCHCFVRDGKIQFLDDCGHALAGQTVEMEEDA